MSSKMTMQEAISEAKRCLNCSKPLCRGGCPIEHNIPEFVRALSEGNIGSAYATIAERSNLPAICGRVCAHEKQCEANCILVKKNSPIPIGSLEMFIADFAHEHGLNPLPPSTGKRGKVAVIGSGPAGLTVAGDLAKMDFAVTIFEGQSEPGGVLLFGIPDFRLAKDVVRREIEILQKLGVEIITDKLIGPDMTVDTIFEQGFDAIFMGTGTALPKILDIPGKDLSGIITATYFLRVVVLSDAGKLDKKDYRVYTVLGDGEVEEGQVWEAAMFAAHNKLDNLTLFVDQNGLQIDGSVEQVCGIEPLDKKFEAFGFEVIKIDGHDFEQIQNAVEKAKTVKGKPTAILAKTVKGKGISFMENQVGWHGVAPNKEQYEAATAELQAQIDKLEGEC